MNKILASTVAFGLALSLAACGESKDKTTPAAHPSKAYATPTVIQPNPVEHCLYVSIQKFPSWDEASGRITDKLPECRSLSTDQKKSLRRLMLRFVDSYELDQSQVTAN